jgi:hypothetical protein
VDKSCKGAELDDELGLLLGIFVAVADGYKVLKNGVVDGLEADILTDGLKVLMIGVVDGALEIIMVGLVDGGSVRLFFLQWTCAGIMEAIKSPTCTDSESIDLDNFIVSIYSYSLNE